MADIFQKFRPNFIGFLTDARADDRTNILSLGAKIFHRRKGILQHTQFDAPVARMGRADDASLGVVEQDWLAIGCEYPQDQSRCRGHHSIGFGRICQRRCKDLHLRRMDLMNRLQVIGWPAKKIRNR